MQIQTSIYSSLYFIYMYKLEPEWKILLSGHMVVNERYTNPNPNPLLTV